jgi:hypothetical protein
MDRYMCRRWLLRLWVNRRERLWVLLRWLLLRWLLLRWLLWHGVWLWYKALWRVVVALCLQLLDLRIDEGVMPGIDTSLLVEF